MSDSSYFPSGQESDQVPLPSELLQLTYWAQRIEGWLTDGGEPNSFLRGIFRPHPSARRSMMRLSAHCPGVIQRLDRALLDCDNHYLTASDGEEYAVAFNRSLEHLRNAIVDAVDAIRQHECTNQPSTEKPIHESLKVGKRAVLAWQSYKRAEQAASSVLTDKEAYTWLSDNPDIDGGYTLPNFSTWTRHLRIARRAYGEQKHTPRSGRQARSVLRTEETG